VRGAAVSAPTWWPPKVGARLRDSFATGVDPKARGRLWHVVAVFQEDITEGRWLAVVRLWSRRRGWQYEIVTDYQAKIGSYLPERMATPGRRMATTG
jgi:hypothetical protein